MGNNSDLSLVSSGSAVGCSMFSFCSWQLTIQCHYDSWCTLTLLPRHLSGSRARLVRVPPTLIFGIASLLFQEKEFHRCACFFVINSLNPQPSCPWCGPPLHPGLHVLVAFSASGIACHLVHSAGACQVRLIGRLATCSLGSSAHRSGHRPPRSRGSPVTPDHRVHRCQIAGLS